MSEVENQDESHSEKLLFQQIPACERKDQLRGKDDTEKVIHEAFRCRLCGKFPVSPCESCSFYFCKMCKDQHHCTHKNVNVVHPHDEKGNQRSSQKAIFPDIQKCDSM